MQTEIREPAHRHAWTCFATWQQDGVQYGRYWCPACDPHAERTQVRPISAEARDALSGPNGELIAAIYAPPALDYDSAPADTLALASGSAPDSPAGGSVGAANTAPAIPASSATSPGARWRQQVSARLPYEAIDNMPPRILGGPHRCT